MQPISSSVAVSSVPPSDHNATWPGVFAEGFKSIILSSALLYVTSHSPLFYFTAAGIVSVVQDTSPLTEEASKIKAIFSSTIGTKKEKFYQLALSVNQCAIFCFKKMVLVLMLQVAPEMVVLGGLGAAYSPTLFDHALSRAKATFWEKRSISQRVYLIIGAVFAWPAAMASFAFFNGVTASLSLQRKYQLKAVKAS